LNPCAFGLRLLAPVAPASRVIVHLVELALDGLLEHEKETVAVAESTHTVD
jgi:hypothetical protein